VTYHANPDESATYLTFHDPNSCFSAVKVAQEIIWAVDRHNLLQPPSERYHVRIGIASAAEFVGAAQSASTLADRAQPDQGFIDSGSSGLGVPDYMLGELSPVARGYPLRLQRLLKTAPADFARNGLVALYPDRDTLRHDVTPAKLLYMAAPNSEMLIAGRTLISWTRLADELAFHARQKGLRYKFLISSPNSCSILGEQEVQEIERDYPLAKRAFTRIADDNPNAVEIRETDQAVVDGISCLDVLLPGISDSRKRTLLVLQDVNAAPGSGKPTLVFACHNTTPESNCTCMAHGLFNRTKLRIDKASLPKVPARPTTPFVPEEGLKGRNNSPSMYARRMSGVFDSIIQGTSKTVPAPFCVQVQVSDICSTYCKMCEHYMEQNERAKQRGPDNSNPDSGHGLSLDQWKGIFLQLGQLGVRATVFSGGEPLMRRNVHHLAREARTAGLSVGLLTNGSTTWEKDLRQAILPDLAEAISWAAVSVDGIADVDRIIRNPTIDEKERIARIAEFAAAVLQKREREPGRLSASVTLQKGNIIESRII
jgi:organic radical activating enzyme